MIGPALPNLEPHRAAVECEIEVDGKPIEPELYPFVRLVTVRMARGASTTVEIALDSLRDERGRWAVQDAGVFEPWRKIRIDAWFGARSEEVMRGYIKRVVADYPSQMGEAGVTVEGQDAQLLLDRTHLRRSLVSEQATRWDADLVQEVAREAELRADTERGLRSASLNIDETAASFLRKRAEANGYELFLRGDTLHFHPPRLEVRAAGRILVYAGPDTNCLRFNVDHDHHRPESVRVTRAADDGDPKKTRPLTQRPDLPLLGGEPLQSERRGLRDFSWYLKTPAGASRLELERRAQAKANDNAWKITARGELDGALYGHVLLPHTTVEVDGVGDSYGGDYYVDQVTHTFSGEGYRQEFALLRNAVGRGR